MGLNLKEDKDELEEHMLKWLEIFHGCMAPKVESAFISIAFALDTVTLLY